MNSDIFKTVDVIETDTEEDTNDFKELIVTNKEYSSILSMDSNMLSKILCQEIKNSTLLKILKFINNNTSKYQKNGTLLYYTIFYDYLNHYYKAIPTYYSMYFMFKLIPNKKISTKLNLIGNINTWALILSCMTNKDFMSIRNELQDIYYKSIIYLLKQGKLTKNIVDKITLIICSNKFNIKSVDRNTLEIVYKKLYGLLINNSNNKKLYINKLQRELIKLYDD